KRDLFVREFSVRWHFQIAGMLHGLNQMAGIRLSRFDDGATVAARQNAALALEGQTAGARPVVMASDAASLEDGRDVFLELLRQTSGSEPADKRHNQAYGRSPIRRCQQTHPIRHNYLLQFPPAKLFGQIVASPPGA